jgi:predicted  nucleic acid-binding Zn-ribbon protein
LLQAPLEEQRALLQLQAHDSAIDRLSHRRGSLSEDIRLAELADALATVDQLSAERQGNLATVQREQSRLEHEIDMVTTKASNEEMRAVSGKVTSPKELTAIQEEVASLKRRQGTLEDQLLELMEQRETLEAELAELATRRQGFTTEQVEVTKARDAALAEIDRELDGERTARDTVTPGVGEQLRDLYDQVRSRQGGVGAAALVGNTCQGCRVSISPVELAAIRKLPPEEIKRCENCRRILVVQ